MGAGAFGRRSTAAKRVVPDAVSWRHGASASVLSVFFRTVAPSKFHDSLMRLDARLTYGPRGLNVDRVLGPLLPEKGT